MASYMSMVDETTASHREITAEEKPVLLRKPLRIDPKIRAITVRDGDGKQSMWKWRVKRGDKALRPPPGGAAAQQMLVSMISFLLIVIVMEMGMVMAMMMVMVMVVRFRYTRIASLGHRNP